MRNRQSFGFDDFIAEQQQVDIHRSRPAHPLVGTAELSLDRFQIVQQFGRSVAVIALDDHVKERGGVFIHVDRLADENGGESDGFKSLHTRNKADGFDQILFPVAEV